MVIAYLWNGDGNRLGHCHWHLNVLDHMNWDVLNHMNWVGLGNANWNVLHDVADHRERGCVKGNLLAIEV